MIFWVSIRIFFVLRVVVYFIYLFYGNQMHYFSPDGCCVKNSPIL